MNIDSDFAMTINGQRVTTDNTLPVYNPATRSVFAQVPNASKSQLDDTVSAARQAFGSWSKTPYDDQSGDIQVHNFGAGVFGGEAVFAPRDGSSSEDDGYVICFT